MARSVNMQMPEQHGTRSVPDNVAFFKLVAGSIATVMTRRPGMRERVRSSSNQQWRGCTLDGLGYKH
jgi:hypothetical protein